VKKIVLLSAGAVIAGSLVTVAAPAEAASLDYTCNDQAGATAENSMTAPTTMIAEDSAPVTIDSVLTVPGTVLTGLVAPLTLTGTGTGGAHGTITGPGAFSQAIAPVAGQLSGVSASGATMALSGTTTFAPSLPGIYQVTAGHDTATLDTLLAGVLGALALDCAPAAGSNPVLGTIRVLSPSTTDLAVSPTTVAYGQASRATAKVTSSLPSPPAGLGAASGTVTFSVGGKTVNGALTSGQTSVSLPRLGAGHTYPVTAVYEPDSSSFYDESRGNAALMVVKDGTRTVVTAPTIKRRHVEVATLKVRSTHGATVRGTVRAVLKKGTKTLRAKTVTLRKGTVKVRFGKLRKKGRYTVVATYRGSLNFKRSVDKDAFRVR
jgi:hypothetical protein